MSTSGAITTEEISVMNWITMGMAGNNWQQNSNLAFLVATVCVKTGIDDANCLLNSWNTQLFQLGLVELGLVNVDDGQEN